MLPLSNLSRTPSKGIRSLLSCLTRFCALCCLCFCVAMRRRRQAVLSIPRSFTTMATVGSSSFLESSICWVTLSCVVMIADFFKDKENPMLGKDFSQDTKSLQGLQGQVWRSPATDTSSTHTSHCKTPILSLNLRMIGIITTLAKTGAMGHPARTPLCAQMGSLAMDSLTITRHPVYA